MILRLGPIEGLGTRAPLRRHAEIPATGMMNGWNIVEQMRANNFISYIIYKQLRSFHTVCSNKQTDKNNPHSAKIHNLLRIYAKKHENSMDMKIYIRTSTPTAITTPPTTNKKAKRVFQLSPLQYPEPGSNRHGSESTGVWDQRVYQFRHLGFCVAKVKQFCELCNTCPENFLFIGYFIHFFVTPVGLCIINTHCNAPVRVQKCYQADCAESQLRGNIYRYVCHTPYQSVGCFKTWMVATRCCCTVLRGNDSVEAISCKV